jgi:hypothetical protein
MPSEFPDTVRTAANRANSVVIGELFDLAGTLNVFETDQALGDTPTLYLTITTPTNILVRRFLLEEVCYYMNPTAAVTYQLFLLEAASADNVEQLQDLVFFSPAAQADSVCYKYNNLGYCADVASTTAEVLQYKLPCVVELTDPGKLYYMLDWSGAPGDTLGFIKIRGRLLK